MPTSTYTPLATTTLGANATTVTFSSISQSYRDLILVTDGTRTTTDSISIRLQFNGDTGSNYSTVYMYGTGSSAASGSITTDGVYTARIAPTRAIGQTNIFDYSATDKHKTVLSRGNAADYITIAYAGRWANTAAITSIVCSIEGGSGQFATGMTFSLYGIAS